MTDRLFLDRSGSSAAEFALVLPLLLILLFGVIDAGRWLWIYNEAEKATQMGARFAVVTYPVTGDYNASQISSDTGLYTSYLGVGGLTQGDVIPAADFGKITCTDAACKCTTAPCPVLGTFHQTYFRNIVDRMKLFLPQLGYSNVAVEYSSSGLGYAGDPNGADLSPLVTIRIGGDPANPDEANVAALQFTPITSLMLASINMPGFTTSLTAEDLTGSQSN